MPRALGGTDAIDNLAGCCKRCNQLKGAIEPERFARILARLAGDVPEHGTDEFRALAKALAHRGE